MLPYLGHTSNIHYCWLNRLLASEPSFGTALSLLNLIHVGHPRAWLLLELIVAPPVWSDCQRGLMDDSAQDEEWCDYGSLWNKIMRLISIRFLFLWLYVPILSFHIFFQNHWQSIHQHPSTWLTALEQCHFFFKKNVGNFRGSASDGLLLRLEKTPTL